MPELELALRQLGAELAFPPEPDITTQVRRRIGEAPARGFAWRRLAAVAVAVLALAVAAAFAVPSARSTILDWLGIKGVKVTRVDRLPAVGLLSDDDLGREVSLTAARQRAPWLVTPDPERFGAPDHVYYSAAVPGGQVTFIWGSKARTRLLMMQSPGTPFAEKLLVPGTFTAPVEFDGRRGVWLYGEPHVFAFRDRTGSIREESSRLARNTLLWEHDELTVRLEGSLSEQQALAIARSVR